MSDENAARSMHSTVLSMTQREEIHNTAQPSAVLMMTQREEMQHEDRSIGPQAELNLSTTRKG